jgi:hypothetical protein
MKKDTVTPPAFVPLQMSNSDLALKSLARDCAPDQFVRELVVNSAQAIQDSGQGDTVIVGPAEIGQYKGKFCVVDNGPGMTLEELKIKTQLFANLSDQERNFGIGGKISTLARSHRSPYGVVIQTRKDKETSVAYLSYAPASVAVEPWRGKLPDLIKDHGTVVYVLGNHDEDDTMLDPTGLRKGVGWLIQYLNSRFERDFPHVVVKVYDSPSKKGTGFVYVRMKGLLAFLSEHDCSGTVRLINSGFNGSWYLLPEDRTTACKRASNTNISQGGRSSVGKEGTEGAGQVCICHEGEFYNVLHGIAQMRRFGIWAGLNRFVLILRPMNPTEYRSNIARTTLERKTNAGAVPIDMGLIAEEFKNNLPKELKKFLESKVKRSQTTVERRDDRLWACHGQKFVEGLGMPVAFNENGVDSDDEKPSFPNLGDGSSECEAEDEGVILPPKPKPERPEGKDNPRKRTRGTNIPTITPIWVENDSDVLIGHFENSGANTLQLNSNWLGLEAMRRVCKETITGLAAEDPALQDVADDTIRHHIERVLTDSILSSLEFRQAKRYTEDMFLQATSDEALTAIASAREHCQKAVVTSISYKTGHHIQKKDASAHTKR